MNYDQLTQQETDDAIAREELAAKLKKDEETRQLRADLTRLESLATNEDFNWFLVTHLVPILQREHDNALNPGNSKESREIAVQRHFTANEMLLCLQVETARIKAIIDE